MIFVDTGAWFASSVPSDPDHQMALRWLSRNQQPLVTTDYVVDETLTLLRARGENQRAIRFGNGIFQGNTATIHYLTQADILDAWRIFHRFADKEWSFTDCSSKVFMEKLGITTAFAFDHHFSQFDGIQVVPDR
jgi:uncharacterized protein